jgi:hypothetical protein
MALTLAERRKPSGDPGLKLASKTPDGSRHSAYMTHKVSDAPVFQSVLANAP